MKRKHSLPVSLILEYDRKRAPMRLANLWELREALFGADLVSSDVS
jgi:hypothetical protein